LIENLNQNSPNISNTVKEWTNQEVETRKKIKYGMIGNLQQFFQIMKYLFKINIQLRIKKIISEQTTCKLN
jgi:hypothetical protein